MLKRFVAACEEKPGAAWLARFHAGREETERWYCGKGLTDAPSAIACRDALRRHMPELTPHYDRVCALVGDDDMAHRILSHYRPPPVAHGCSQAVWLGEDGPALVRNYDYPLEVVSDRFELTNWSGRRVIGKAQRPWGGCLDGMNEDGLVAGLTFGGSRAQGLGFSIILILRYVLESCRCVDEAVSALGRVPVALSQNVTLFDRTGAYATLFLGPGRAPVVTTLQACTNHQEAVCGPDSVLRQETLLRLLAAPSTTLSTLVGHFLEARFIPADQDLRQPILPSTGPPRGAWITCGRVTYRNTALISSEQAITRTNTGSLRRSSAFDVQKGRTGQ